MNATAVPAGTPRTWRRWRRIYFIGAAVVTAALAAGIAYASLTANGGGSGNASTSTVSIGTPASTTCSYLHLAPGDSMANCSLGVTYTGSIPAWMSLTVAIQSKPGRIGGSTLYHGNTAGLTFSISDGHNSFTVPTGAGTTGGTCPAGNTCWSVANDLAAWYGGSTPNLSFANTRSATWTVTPVFPRTSGNPYQGSTATLTLTAQAVQTAANALPAVCTTSTIGQPCAPTASFSWS